MLSARCTVSEATARAEDAFDKLTSMGLRSESASSTKTKGIVTLLKSLKLIKQTTTGPKGAKIAMLQMTPSGRVVLPESPGTGGIRVGLVRQLVAQSSTLSALLGALDEQGPLRRPVLSRQPGAPSRGAPYVQAIEDGVAQFWSTLLWARIRRGRCRQGQASESQHQRKYLLRLRLRLSPIISLVLYPTRSTRPARTGSRLVVGC